MSDDIKTSEHTCWICDDPRAPDNRLCVRCSEIEEAVDRWMNDDKAEDQSKNMTPMNELERTARRIAAGKMRLVKDPDGLNLPDELWQQALPDAERECEERFGPQAGR